MPLTLSATGVAHIMIANDDAVNPSFRNTVVEALGRIANGGPIGTALLNAIANAPVAADPAGFKVKIMRPNVTATIGAPGLEGGSRAVAYNELDGRAGGAGTKAACYWNPNIYNTPGGARPAYIALAHELIHCYHYTNGLAQAGYQQEEEFTVGLGPHIMAAITENRIRLEHNVPIRHVY